MVYIIQSNTMDTLKGKPCVFLFFGDKKKYVFENKN